MNRWTRPDKDYLTYEECKEQGCSEYYAREQELCRRLKYFEDLQEQGRLVELPCKVGEAVRAIVNRPFNGNNLTIFGEVSDIQTVVRVVHSGCRYVNFLISDFGKTVFLTEEEALKKMKDE